MISSSEIEKFLGEHAKIFNAIREHSNVFFIISNGNRISVDSSLIYDGGHVYYDIIENNFNFTCNGEISETTDYLFFNVKEAFVKYLKLIEENGYTPDSFRRHFHYDYLGLWKMKTCRQKFLDFVRQKIEEMPDASGHDGQEAMEKLNKEIDNFTMSLKIQKTENDQSNLHRFLA